MLEETQDILKEEIKITASLLHVTEADGTLEADGNRFEELAK